MYITTFYGKVNMCNNSKFPKDQLAINHWTKSIKLIKALIVGPMKVGRTLWLKRYYCVPAKYSDFIITKGPAPVFALHKQEAKSPISNEKELRYQESDLGLRWKCGAQQASLN